VNIAVIGGGINGVMTAWELLKTGHQVALFEKDQVMKQTSSSSSKLLHGGLRYLENFEFRLVKEALAERKWWIEQAPHLAHPLKIYIPVSKNGRRSALVYKLGLWLYDLLAGNKNLGKHQSLTLQQFKQLCPELNSTGLVKGFSYYDGQMDDCQLGLWALQQAQSLTGLRLQENTEVISISEDGQLIYLDNNHKQSVVFDRVINVAGPWTEQLLRESGVKNDYTLDLIRGSHLLIDKKIDSGYFLEIPKESRIFFVLPYQGQMLIGTTEQRQTLDESIEPSADEIDYLINSYNHYFSVNISQKDVVQTFAGLRPLIKSSKDPSKVTREYAIQKNKKIITVFGGKWTTSRQLAKKVVEYI